MDCPGDFFLNLNIHYPYYTGGPKCPQKKLGATGPQSSSSILLVSIFSNFLSNLEIGILFTACTVFLTADSVDYRHLDV